MEFTVDWHQRIIRPNGRRIIYLISSALLLILTQATAQKIISGKVQDKSSKQGIPGSVQIAGTQTGVSTNSDGSFQLLITTDTATLVISTIGWEPQRVRLKGVDYVLIEMRPACHQDYFYQRHIGLEVASGVRYTPLGGKLTLFQPYLWYNRSMQPAARLEMEYEVGTRATYRTGALYIDELVTTCSGFNLDVGADWQQLQLKQPQVEFQRRSIGANITLGRWPPVWMAVGQASIGSERPWRTGVEVGSQRAISIKRKYWVNVQSKLAWWQTCWQWQSSLSTTRKLCTAAIVYRQIGRQYREVQLRVGVKLNLPNAKKQLKE